MQNIVSNSIEALRDLADTSRLSFMERMIPTSKEVICVKTPEIKQIIKSIRVETKGWTERDKIELGIQHIETDIFEMGQIGYELIGKDKKTINDLTKDDLQRMNRGLDNWATVDIFGVYVYGKAWRLGILENNDLLDLVKHPDFWQRRLAVVSTVSLNQKSNGGEGDVDRTLLICKQVVEDYADLVVKALSWALRELSKREPEPVREFMEKYREILHWRVVKEVSNKLNFGKKNL